MKGRILSIGEHIANAGLGLHGDIITTTALGGHAMAVPTFLSTSISPLHRSCLALDPYFIQKQLEACVDAPGVDSIKLGAVNSLEVVLMLGEFLATRCQDMSVVTNPVLTSEAGEYLLAVDAIYEYRTQIIQNTDLLVINIRDAELLTGTEVVDIASMCDAAHALYKLGSEAVLLTGGLLSGDELHDVLMSKAGEEVLTLNKNNVHRGESYRFGGAWALATAIATSLAQGFDLKNSINRARQFVDKAIGTSFNSDENYQSLNLAHTVHPFVHDDSSQGYKIIPGSRFRHI